MGRGGAQRVMNVLASYLCKTYEVILINDIVAEKEYEIDTRVKRIVLTKTGFFKKTREIRRIIKKEKPDIVLSFLGPCNYRNILATHHLKCKTIVSVRNDPLFEYGNGLMKLIARFLFRFADGFVFQTEDAKAYFPKCVQKKAAVIMNPVDDKFYKTKWESKNDEIAVVGRLESQKNPLLALKAFKKVSMNYPHLKMVFYGDGELKDSLMNQINTLDLSDKVILKGVVPNIEKYLAASKLFVMTSDFEGMPNALMEAMAIGVPVICTDCPCGGPRSLIRTNDEGILIKCGDLDNLVLEINKMISDTQLAKTVSRNERARALAFSSERIMKEWTQYLWN